VISTVDNVADRTLLHSPLALLFQLIRKLRDKSKRVVCVIELRSR